MTTDSGDGVHTATSGSPGSRNMQSADPLAGWAPQDSIALPRDLGTETGDPPRVEPPVEPLVGHPPYLALPPEWFERLCVDVAEAIEGVRMRLYGVPGQSQAGIDMYGRRPDGSIVAWQAKRHRDLKAAAIDAAFDRFFSGPPPFAVARLVVVGPFDDRDTKLLDVLERVRQEHGDVEVEIVGVEQLTAALRVYPEIIRRYFGPLWAAHMCEARTTGVPDLADYMSAVERAAQEHPYPGVVPGVLPPPMAHLYTRQRVVADRVTDESPAASEIASMTDLLGATGHCVVTAPAGGGKSSLLRAAMHISVQRWRAGSSLLVPVPAAANDFVGVESTAVLLARAANRSLSPFGLGTPLRDDTFERPPSPQGRWLICVDGLDEVPIASDRAQVMRRLRLYVDADAARSKIIVASRSRSASDAREWQGIRPFGLQPLELEDLAGLIERWFEALGYSDPGGSAGFLDDLRRADMLSIARLPLMAAMLCQLRVAHGDQPVPSGRSEVYRLFVDLLKERQYAGSGGLRVLATESFARFGPTAESAAMSAVERLHDAIAFAAHHQMHGSPESVLALLHRSGLTARPPTVPEHVWADFIDRLLSSSGLVLRRGDDFEFIHQSLKEFMAAQHLRRDSAADSRTYAHFASNRTKRNRPWSPFMYSLVDYEVQELKPYDPPRRTGRRWQPPSSDEMSYFGFAFDVWIEGSRSRDLSRFLRRQVRSARLCVNEALLMLSQMGVQVPDEIVSGAVEAVAAFLPHKFRNSPGHPWPPGDDEVRTWFDHHDLQGRNLVRLAALLHGCGDDRGVERVARFMSHQDVDPYCRLTLATCLLELGDERGRDELMVLTQPRSGATPHQRLTAARELANRPLRRDKSNREAAAEHLSSGARDIHDAGSAPLWELADEVELPMWARIEAATTLASFLGRPGRDRLASFAADSGMDPWSRYRAAVALCELGDREGNDRLVEIVEEPDANGRTRALAAAKLGRIGDPRAIDLLFRLATGMLVDADERVYLAVELAHLGEPEALSRLAVDSSFEAGPRAHAARRLVEHSEGHLRWRAWPTL